MGLKPGARLQMRIENGRLLIEKKVRLDLKLWIGHAEDDGLSSVEAFAELRGRPVPLQPDDAAKKSATAAKSGGAPSQARKRPGA